MICGHVTRERTQFRSDLITEFTFLAFLQSRKKGEKKSKEKNGKEGKERKAKKKIKTSNHNYQSQAHLLLVN